MATVFDLTAMLRLDKKDFDKGLSDAERRANGLGGKLKSGLGTAAKASVAAVGATSAAVGVLMKKAIDGYAQYQQMEGGVKKLYGNMGMTLQEYAASTGKTVGQVRSEYNRLDKAQSMVLKNAQNAYKTAGMSANQYMEMSTQFSAALISSLGGNTVKAAQQTDVAMKAISDNFNTFGGDIGNIQNAFQGFAKQNYTMLDNLKLGYGGTKTEMERLIADANAYAAANGQAANLSINSFSDIVTAIDLIQQKQHIAGTTAREASTTIEGSFMQTKAAWENLVSGFANPKADIGQLVQNVVTSASNALKNLLPAVTQAFSGIGQALQIIIPQALAGLPNMMNNVLMPMLQTGGGVVMSLVQSIVTNLPQLMSAASTMISTLAQGIASALPQLIPVAVQGLITFVQSLVTNAPKLIQGALALIQGLVTGLLNALPLLIAAVPKLIQSLVTSLISSLPKIAIVGLRLVLQLGKAIITSIPRLIVSVVKLAIAIPKGILKALPKMLSAGVSLIKHLWSGLKGQLTGLPSKVGGWIKKIPEKIKEAVSDFLDAGLNLIQGLWDGIKQKFADVSAWVAEHSKGLGATTRRALDERSPSKMFREIGYNVSAGMALGIQDGWDLVGSAMDGMNEQLTNYQPDYEADFGASYTSGTFDETMSVAIGSVFADMMQDMTDMMQDGMARAMENVNITLDKRQFGKMTRKAVANAL